MEQNQIAALTVRALTHWSRFQEADAFSRRALARQLAPAEVAGLERLERNLSHLSPVGEWFEWEGSHSADVRPKQGILTSLLAGLQVDLNAVPELVRACRPAGAGIAGLHKALRRHVAASTPTERPGNLPTEAEVYGPRPTKKQAPRTQPQPQADETDPFAEPDAPRSRTQTAERVGKLLNAKITAPTGDGLREQIEATCDRLKVDLSRRLPSATLERLGTETGCKPHTLKYHLNQIRKERGIHAGREREGQAGNTAPINTAHLRPGCNAARVASAAEQLGIDLNRCLDTGKTQQLADAAGLTWSQTEGAVRRLRSRTGQPSPVHTGAADQVATACARLGLDLKPGATLQQLQQVRETTGLSTQQIRDALKTLRHRETVAPAVAALDALPADARAQAVSVALAVADSLYVATENGDSAKVSALMEASALLRAIIG